jgi:hypothetical protein
LKRHTIALFVAPLLACRVLGAEDAPGDGLAPGVRGVAPRAPQGMKIDGDLSEFKGAFATPVEYFHEDLRNRAGQFLYMWDEEAFYAGLRTLDKKQWNGADDEHLWEGDGVEWYFDTRRGDDFRSMTWTKGAVHCYWTGFKKGEIHPRFCLRPGYLDAIPKTGVEVAARKTPFGAEVEFKLPWANFPGFKAALNEVIALDAELCYSDGGPRVFRTFAYGSPLSVQEPANLARIQLVERLEPAFWRRCGPAMMPLRCDTPWSQPQKPMVTGFLALPPDHSAEIGKVVFRILGLGGETLGEYEGKTEEFEPQGRFQRSKGQWPADAAPPGAHQLLGIIYDRSGKELSRIAPRLVSVNMTPGY